MPKKPRKEIEWLSDKRKLGTPPRRVAYPEFAHLHPRPHQMIFGGPGSLDFPTPLDWATAKPLFRTESEWAAYWRNAPTLEEVERKMAENLRGPEVRKELERVVEFLPRAAETIQEMLTAF